ncbi:MAG: hypothetical protein LBQ04_03470 [Endomicrobium sp.]|nr:hypothetical protein [Endomicrobium sp.]
MKSIRKYEISIDWNELLHFQSLNIKNGNNNTGIPDLIIAQNCIQNNFKFLSCDKQLQTYG